MTRTAAKFLIVIAALLGVSGVMVTMRAGAAHAIANGERVADGRYPFAVKLTMTGIPTAGGGRRDSSCSGGLISPHWVLTAGHCFRDTRNRHVSRPVARKTTATVGRADLTTDAGHVATVVEVRQSKTADVALARIDQGITDIKPLRISRSAPRVGDEVRLAGFGLTDGDATAEPTRMRTGRFEVTSVGRKAIGLSGVAPRSTTSPCPHDSGGPYFSEDDGAPVVVAVVSHGPTCPHRGEDQGGRIDAVARWITSVVGKDLAATPKARPKPSPSRQARDTKVAAPPSGPAAGLSDLTAYQVSVPAVAVVAGVVGFTALRRRRRRPRGGVHRSR
ncbi:S1 family peptidase [Nucisporomicrobium flavum]|jgi:Trypsin|uniref:S1 family peptidase n=1 Tax=Nucisporomicrobium flavum TaxID=2785915 RepID=UPI003C2F40CF